MSATTARAPVIMNVVDTSPDGHAKFRCPECRRRTEWIMLPKYEARRGISCPTCNDPTPPERKPRP